MILEPIIMFFMILFVTFQYRVLNHLELYCILTIEACLKLSINFNCRYLELCNACIFSLMFTVLNVRDEIESKCPSIAFFLVSV